MANKKKGGRRRQGLVSWVTSILALAIGLSGVATTLKVGGLNGLANRASFGALSGKFKLNEGLVIYAPMLGAIVFKTLFAELARKARIQSLIPRIG